MRRAAAAAAAPQTSDSAAPDSEIESSSAVARAPRGFDHLREGHGRRGRGRGGPPWRDHRLRRGRGWRHAADGRRRGRWRERRHWALVWLRRNRLDQRPRERRRWRWWWRWFL